MWCLNASCGFEGPGPFCQKCGSKMIDDRSLDTVVICNGQLDDDSSCQAVLVPNQRFCNNCGIRVDPGLFAANTKTCTKCGTVLKQGSDFCSACYHRHSKPLTFTDPEGVFQGEKSNSDERDKNAYLEQFEGSTGEKGLNEDAKCTSGTVAVVELLARGDVSGNTEQGKQAQLNRMAKNVNSQATSEYASKEKHNAALFNEDMKTNMCQSFDNERASVYGTCEQNVTSDQYNECKMKATYETNPSGGDASGKIKHSDDGEIKMIDKSAMNKKEISYEYQNPSDVIKFPTNRNMDLSTKLGNSGQEKTTMFEEKRDKENDSLDQNDVKVIDTKEERQSAHVTSDSEIDSKSDREESDLNTNLKSSFDSAKENAVGQAKRVKKQKKNKKRRKKDREAKQRNEIGLSEQESLVNTDIRPTLPETKASPSDLKTIVDETKIDKDITTQDIATENTQFSLENTMHISETGENVTTLVSGHNNLLALDTSKNNVISNVPQHPEENSSSQIFEAGQNSSAGSEMNADKDIDTQITEVVKEPKVFGMGETLTNTQQVELYTASSSVKCSLFVLDKEEDKTLISPESSVGTQKATASTEPLESKQKRLDAEGNEESDDTENVADEEESDEDEENESKETEKKKDDEGTNVDVSNKKLSKKQQKQKKKKERKKKKAAEKAANADGRKPVTRSDTRASDDKLITVHFHVLVSEAFKFDPAKHKLILVMGKDEMGGWDNYKKVMSVKRQIEGCIYELVYEMPIPARLISQNDNFPYKYFFHKEGKQGYFEHYRQDDKYGVGRDRILEIPSKLKHLCEDVWYQFDGFAERSPETFSGKVKNEMKKFFSLPTDLTKRAEKALTIFCPKVSDIEQLGPTEILKRMQMLVECLKKVYIIDARCWQNYQNPYMEFVGKCLIPTMLELWDIEAERKNPTGKDKESRLMGSMIIICTLYVLEIELPAGKIAQTVCKSLLVTADTEKNICPELTFVDNTFPEQRQFLLDAILYVVKKLSAETKDPSWMLLMPWIHFLSKACTPFQQMTVDFAHDNSKPKWWGIENISQQVEYFKGKSGNWTINPKIVLEHIEPLFQMDYFLPRTFMAALELRDLHSVLETGKIPMEVCLANIIYHMRRNKSDLLRLLGDIGNKLIRWYPSESEKDKIVTKCLETVLKQLNSLEHSDHLRSASYSLIYMFGYDLLAESTSCDRKDHVCLSVQACLGCIALYDICTDSERRGINNDQKVLSLKDMINHAEGKLISWMDIWQNNWISKMEDILKVWNRLFAPDSLRSSIVRDEWNRNVAQQLLCKIYEVCANYNCTGQFVQLYCRQLDKFNTCLQECLSQASYQAINEAYAVDNGQFSREENRRLGLLLSEMFDTEWQKSVDKSEKDLETSILTHVLQWPPFHQFLLYYNDEKMKDMLRSGSKENLVQSVKLLERRSGDLVSGAVTIGDLKFIVSKQEKFVELIEILQSTNTPDKIAKAIHMRQKELQAFQEQAAEMATLTALCQHLRNVDRRSVDETLQKQENIQRHMIKEFCEPGDPNEVDSLDTYVPKLWAFKVPVSVLDELSDIHRCNVSNIFRAIWTDKCEGFNARNISLQEVIQSVWRPVKKTLDSISKQITSGRIKFTDFEKFVARLYGDDYEAMVKEMTILKVTERCARQRTDQLKKYRQMEDCVNGAKTILKFKLEYKLEGDFDQIELIATHHANDLEMASFDESVMKTCDFLKDLTPARAECLQMFVRCQKVVQWLKESMKSDGLKELKVFVDLAFMSAGDDNIARVQCLHSAVTGYAPLIFELKQESSYTDLLRLCEIVWKDLDANKNLPKMLEETSRHLSWLKEIEKTHGSVEVNSLMQAEAINESGIYTVGTNAWKKEKQKKTADGSLQVLADTVQLTVPLKDDEQVQDTDGNRRNYTFSQLQDLQSRLMLVAGKAVKSTESVERFTMIFVHVTRLNNVYLKLCSSGCVLFKDFTARFFCNPKLPVCIYINFGQGERAPQLKGRRSKTEDLKDIIPQIAKFMEKCLDGWMAHIKEKRKSYHHLNYFTVDQLVILQRELVKMGTDEEEPRHHIYPLLSAVKQNCTPADLLEAMTAAKSEIEGDDNMEFSVEDIDDSEDTQAEATLDEKKRHFIQELVDAGYEEALVIRALEFVDSYDVTEGMVWCMENENTAMSVDTEEITDPEDNSQRDQRTQKSVFTGWTKSDTDMQTLISDKISLLGKQEETGAEPLLEELSALWTMFLESISSNIRDYLSLEHLGIVLKHLSRKNKQVVCRCLPPVFKEGEPNLIITPSGEVLMSLLSVYMMDEDQPLPLSEEVLLCTPNTTKDEVDIFWRRALFDEGKKIHCLLNADLLDYDVSEAAERCLQEYLVDICYTEPKYRLLVICGTDNEYKSGIASSLEKYKRQTLPYNIQRLRDYLLHKLTIDQRTVSGIKPAASVDRERSSVRVIKSWRAGVGKTLFKERREDELSRLNRGTVQYETVSIPLQEKHVDLHYVICRLLEHTTQPGEIAARLFHMDVSHEVQYGVDYLLFNLLILGCLVDKTGFVWRKSPADLYLIETMPLMIRAADKKVGDLQYVHQLLGVLPDLTCRSPQESLQIYEGNQPRDFQESDQLFDDKQFRSTVFQRTFQYLYRLDQGRQLEDVDPRTPQGSPADCLETLLKHCGIEDPSWSELHHFVWFLNTQLEDFEKNSFVSAAAAEDLPGFTKFVLRFLITMSRDFSTRSLNMNEESPGVRLDVRETGRAINDIKDEEEESEDDLQVYKMRRTWESSPHPYLFFNSDRVSFTFLGFYIDQASGNLIDQQTNRVLERSIMTKNLYDALVRNNAPMKENFDALPRDQKIMKLCNLMGIDLPHDPDDTYELTTDNVKKILAIYMRFRCDIPVIIMGETGCGKTRLIKFMCGLQVPPGVEMTNMILMKVHGGTTKRDIINTVELAEKKARENRVFGKHMYTVLFFDEANTTEAVGLIKEIMCDKSMEGTKLKLCENLKIVAAVNPYRKHSDELIRKLEQAGLGYHVDADDTTDRLGRVPMRRLVYRVQPLPQSLLPLVWDFGQLNTQVEDLYIRQMVRRYIREDKLPDILNLKETVSAILTASQEYMRAQEDECSFVSLRDVDRVLTVMSWFYQHSQEQRTLFDLMDRTMYDDEDENSTSSGEAYEDYEAEDDFEEMKIEEYRVDDVTRSLILALGVCYHACLKTREEYRDYIARYFRPPCQLPSDGAEQIRKEIECCQEVFLEDIDLEKNIARNMALKENVFMMVVCIELRIPLFLVGKPGSSKSLAKIIVSDAMQGNAAKTQLFKELKQAQMVSFQCSPLSTPDGIVATFKQCAQFQKDKDLETFVSIVVLDEVGLAEDSPRMPLKTLHPLLEDGCQGNEKPEKYQKVAFIGISNWALDPAKMNRGILVQREVPDLEELKSSASGICSTNKDVGRLIEPLIEPMAISYLEVFEKASRRMREFYGLRDFYSLVKMVYGFVERSKQKPTWHEIVHAIMRNFGGLDEVDAVESFRKNLATLVHIETERRQHDPDSSSTGLIRACLTDKKNESRYLLLLTENYGALSIIQQQILSHSSDIHPITIFGSSFRSDLEYTQVCRNINKIKVCMETGNTVVLLNLENLYESLYDALNQYYVYFGGERYVDLGLGTHRVKCPVHKTFRLIVVAEKQTVYKKFPIPLINRLEKHFLTINTMLTLEQQNVVQTLQEWTKQFITVERQTFQRKDKVAPKIGNVFIGYHDDTCSAIVLDVCEKFYDTENPLERRNQVLQEAKNVLLWCATPESLVKLDDNHSIPDQEKKYLQDQYNNRQQHGSLAQYLHHFVETQHVDFLLAQVTTHSRLLAGVHKTEISQCTGIAVEKILLLENLSSFDTEQQFTNRIQHHLRNIGRETGLMIIQCDSGDVNANLIACARYCVRDELEKMKEHLQANVHVVFIVQLPREGKFTGFQCGQWHSVHIDDLFKEDKNMPTLQDMKGRSAAEIFSYAVEEPVDMEIDQIPHRENEFAEERMDWTSSSKDITLYQRDQTVNFELCGETRNKPVQLDDVQFDVHSVDQNIGRHANYTHSKVNVKGIILNCVHAALSMVKDKTEHMSRETERVSLVLKLLHHDKEGQSSFFHGLCCLVKKLLTEKESKVHVSSRARNWLIKEAAANENINKAGTFRRSCQQTLEAKVSPVLAGIIAYLDTNDNLSILEDMDTAWKREIWLLFLNTSDAISLQFSDLQSPATQTELHEVLVMSTGYEGHLFRAQMPFSWLLIGKIAEILKLPNPKSTLNVLEGEALGTDSRVSSTVRVLSQHAIGCILAKIAKEHVTEATKNYIKDFVHTLYNAATEQEYQLVIQSLYDVSTRNGEENSLLHRLVHVHVAYETLSVRLNCFREMNSVWPGCSSVIIEVKDSNPDHFMFREQDFTFSTLCLLIETLTPKSNGLNNQLGRSQWLNNVHRYRPVVEKVICLHRENPELYGNNALNSVRRAKCMWSRVMAVKLFLEHVCSMEKDAKIFKHCMTFWTVLGDDTDFKDIKSLNGVEKFLKICYRQATNEFLGTEKKCSQCESVLEGPPVTLPCKDVLCEHCFDAKRALEDNTCNKCQRNFNAGWKPLNQATDNTATEKLKDYQTRCNAFFMDVVSQLCFADNTEPKEEVVIKLLGLIFITTRHQQQRTRDLTIFETGIDPNPVFRSFLLQLLMRSSEDNVIKNLRRYLDEADRFVRRDGIDDAQHVDLGLLVVQCLEDMFTQKAGRADIDEVQYATQALKRAKVSEESEGLTVEKLHALASARMGLAIVAKYIADFVKHNRDQRQVDVRVRKLIEAAQILCEDTRVEWNRVYLVKCLCRCFGIDVYQTICRAPAPFLRWIAIRNMDRETVVEVSDRYIVCGEMYITLRESVTKVILGQNTKHLAETLKKLKKHGDILDPILQLAVHREVACSNLYPPQQRKITAQIINTLEQFVNSCEFVRNKQMHQDMLNNQLVPRRLVVQEGEELHQQGISCLIVHYLSVMTNIQGDRTLLDPLISLINRPESMLNAFLPTMPQDELEDAKEALLAARNQISGADDNPVFYKCPNGHIYVIGNCGRPSVVDRCTCGAEIGGQNHNLLPSNTQYTGRDTTLTGHILGHAEARARGAQPERELSPAYCSSIRLIIHMAMYLGTGNNPQAIQNMIRPDNLVNDVEEFLWLHILRDLDDMHIALGLSVDDVILLMHTVINGILTGYKKGGNIRAPVTQWNSKESRRHWETAFSSKFLEPLFKDISNLLKKNNLLLAKDQRLGANPLLCLLYEIETETGIENAANLEQIPRVWRYRTPVSLQHLRQEVQARVRHNQHKVLQLFLREEHILRAMRYIPSILRLHRALFQKYQRKLDKAEASQITVAQLRKEEFAGEETTKLLQDFVDAWELVRNSLFLYLCPTEIGGTTVANEYCSRTITDKTPVVMLLPTTKESGLCSFALLDFLFRKQNDFLDKYFKEAKRNPASMSTVQPRDVTSAHLISYDHQHDIMPLILANCQYSFEIGKGTKIDYDFAGLERQLMDRFLFSKSRINVGKVLEIDLMQYRTEFTNAEVFRKLEDKIPQETLGTVVKAQIISECKSLPDLCQSLDNLDITISFLKSTGGPQERRLHEFMRETLQMEASVYSQKAQQCEFRHLRSLWLLLSLQKSKKMADSGQHTKSIFESVSNEFHEEIPEELYTLFKEYAMNKLSVEKLTQLVEILHEYILLVVAVRQHPIDEYTITTNKKVCEWLTGYLERFDQPALDVAFMVGFPEDILYKHSVHTWMSAYTFLKQKQSRDRY